MKKWRVLDFQELAKLRSELVEVEPARAEKESGILYKFQGDGVKVPRTFTLFVLKDLSIRTNDPHAVEEILNDSIPDESKFSRKILIDDCGWGSSDEQFGVLVGVLDTLTGKYQTYLIPSIFFREGVREKKIYLSYSRKIAKRIMEDFKPDENTIFLVCTSYVLKEIRNTLRKKGYAVKGAVIGEPLQSRLRDSYIRMSQKFISREFRRLAEMSRKPALQGA